MAATSGCPVASAMNRLLPAALAAAWLTLPASAADLAAEQPLGEPELVATFDGAMLTGVCVARDGRTFVNFPRWGDDPACTVAELVDGEPVAYPSPAMNPPLAEARENPSEVLVSVQSVVIDPANRLWILDTANPKFQGVIGGGAKLVGVDLATDEVFQTVTFPDDVVLKDTYLNDVRFDLSAGEAGTAYITDSSAKGPCALIVVDLASGESRRVLSDHPSVRAEPAFLPFVEGRPLLQNPGGQPPKHLPIGSDGIALSADGQHLFFTPLAGRHLYRVPTASLRDGSVGGNELGQMVEDLGDRGFASDGLESDAADNLYLTNYEDNAVVRRSPEGVYQTILHDPRLLWPDTLAVAADGHLYVTANQLHRQATYQNGKDQRDRPYALFRVPIGSEPIPLRAADPAGGDR